MENYDTGPKKKKKDTRSISSKQIQNLKNNNNNWTRLLCGSEISLNFIFNRKKNLRTIR